MNTAKVKLRIRNFRAIREAEIEVSKTILYGPNGGGKSTAIHALLTLLTRGIDPLNPDETLFYGLRAGSEIEVSYGQNHLRLRDLVGEGQKIELSCRAGEREVIDSSIDNYKLWDCAKQFWKITGIERVSYIRGDRMKSFAVIDTVPLTIRGKEIKINDIEDFGEWQSLASHPEIVFRDVGGEVLSSIILGTIGGSRIYNGYIYDSDRKAWHPLHQIAYGFKRRSFFYMRWHSQI